jgi:hypothetical protein
MEPDSSGVSTGLVINDPAIQAFILIYLGICLFSLIIQWVIFWRIFKKAGRPGWGAIIPVYQYYVMLKITGKPVWWLILAFVPIVNIVVFYLISLSIAKVFNKGTGFAIGIFVWPILFYAILAFDKSQYIGLGVPLVPGVNSSEKVNSSISPIVLPTINVSVMPSANTPTNPPVNPPTANPGQ